MDEILLAERFEEERPRLRALAYRMLGASAEAEDAVQEAWLRLARIAQTEAGDIDNLAAWLTTVISRVCLNLLRSRETRRESSLEGAFTDDWLGKADEDLVPEAEAELADSVGLALLVVLDTLSPAERIAFVLHDLFEVGFEDIAHMMERNTAAVRQLASRARRRVRGAEAREAAADPLRQRQAVQAYLAATRVGDFEALLTLLDPDVVLHADGAVMPGGGSALSLQGALTVAKAAIAAVGRARFTAMAQVDGADALVMAPLGHLALVIRFEFAAGPHGLIRVIDVVARPERLSGLEITV